MIILFKQNINLYSSILDCKNLEGMKKCTIPIDHFIGKKTGPYRIQHSNHESVSTIYYESSPINVILPEEKIIEIYVKDEDNNKEINVGQNGIIYFITDYNDNETNIFDPNDIIEFNTTIEDKNLNKYSKK